MAVRPDSRLTSCEVPVFSDCTVAPGPARSSVAFRVAIWLLLASCSVDPPPTTKVPPVSVEPNRLESVPPTRLIVLPASTDSRPLLLNAVAIVP